jgi:Dyp-type peroxidase family
MMMPPPVREAPAATALSRSPDPAHPDVGDDSPQPEPELDVDEIQGNVVPGFLKDFQMMLFLEITDSAACKLWLAPLVPRIATTEEVLAFNRLFKAIRRRRGRETHELKATWLNIAFSASGLRRLGVDVNAFRDEAFKDGMAVRAMGNSNLGDPSNRRAEGNPRNWLVGGPGNQADIVLILASDDCDDLLDMVEELETSIYAFRRGRRHARSGVRIIFKQPGANLVGPLAGHEHFGFLDGVSQPGIRGRVSSDDSDVLTLRQNPREPDDQGKPGQDLLWPGEFIFGYEGQDRNKPVEEPSDDPVTAGPGLEVWAKNGSFLVFRRLRQDVGAFHTFLNEQAATLGLQPRELGAKLVGRWASGAPILRTDAADDPSLGANDCANNDFEFFNADPVLADPNDPPPDTIPPVSAGIVQCAVPALFDPSLGDQPGAVCPFAGHIRKAYPRDDITSAGAGAHTPEEQSELSERDTQTHRLLRRGIPFGPASPSTPDVPVQDDLDRGLLFLAYQTSIVNQFEFVTKRWVNNPNASKAGAGHDPIIGQNDSRTRVRRFTVTFMDAKGTQHSKMLNTRTDWVIPTGGGYFFAPSISALESLSR